MSFFPTSLDFSVYTKYYTLSTLVLARQVPDKELKEFLEKNKELLNS